MAQIWRIAGCKAKSGRKNAEVKNQQDYYARLINITTDLDRNAINLKKIETALPDNSDEPSVMNFVQSVAMQSGLILESVDYSGTKTASGMPKADAAVQEGSRPVYSLSSYGVSAVLSGDYVNFKDFLSRIEHSSRLIQVEAISIDNRKASQNESDKISQAAKVGEALNYTVKIAANFYE